MTLYRVDPDALAPHLPAGLRLRIRHGAAWITAAYTHLEGLGHRWLPRRLSASFQHLAFRVGVELDERRGGGPGGWVLRRETSSWWRARCGQRLQQCSYQRSTFRVANELRDVELEVRGSDNSEFYLRAAPSEGGWHGRVFATAVEARAFLGEDRVIWPADAFAPEADDFQPDERVQIEPLAVLDMRSSVLDRLAPSGSRALEGAARFVTRRPIAVLRPRPRRAPQRTPTQSALPSV